MRKAEGAPLPSELDSLSDTLEEAILSILQVVLPIERIDGLRYLGVPVHDALEFILQLQDEIKLMVKESFKSPLPLWRTEDLEADISDSICMVERILNTLRRQFGDFLSH